jgi:homoserine O-succinyltransferase
MSPHYLDFNDLIADLPRMFDCFPLIGANSGSTPDRRAGRAGAQAGETDIVIGLINIMPPAAMRSIELLFRRLLNGCGLPAKIHLRLFGLPNCPGETADVTQDYEGLNALWESPDSDMKLDALIVTGTEARASLMTDEPCWPALQKICDWAGGNTIATLWSCFSAHAAVLHMDNIHRQLLPEKLTGIFECQRASSHAMVENMPKQWAVPHSRYNNLNTAELAANGYEILSGSPSVGADSFIKRHGKSEFLFLQGHLEYAPEMLLSEYCRDLKRFTLGQIAICPKLPANYIGETALEVITALQMSIRSSVDASPSAALVDAVAAKLKFGWQAPALQLFTAWLGTIAARKSARLSAQLAATNFPVFHPSETPGCTAPS